jgi:hypothetical protein
MHGAGGGAPCTDVIGDQDDVPRDAFEQTAAKKIRGGETYYEEVMEKDGKRYLRAATSIPVVSENCVMCHANFKDDKGNVGALSYIVPMIRYTEPNRAEFSSPRKPLDRFKPAQGLFIRARRLRARHFSPLIFAAETFGNMLRKPNL